MEELRQEEIWMRTLKVAAQHKKPQKADSAEIEIGSRCVSMRSSRMGRGEKGREYRQDLG